MKKLTKLILTAVSFVIVVCTTATAQTNVSGGIYTNTTWTLANSPYIAIDTVVVFPGVTLTIQPGVVVKFDNNVQLEIRQATIIAIGTFTDSITFTSNSASPIMGIWDGIEMNQSDSSDFHYCNFKYADRGIYPSNMTGALTIKNSSFNYNNKGLRGLSSAPVYIDSCNFRNNIDAINGNAGNFKVTNSKFIVNQNGFNSMEGSTMKNCIVDSNSVAGINFLHQRDSIISCEVKYNGFGIKSDYGGGIPSCIYKNVITNNNIGIAIYHQIDTIFCNKICNNSTYNVENLVPFGNKNVSITNNFWCTNDSIAISATIYDGYDNVNLGLVFFMPIDTTQCYLPTGIPINEIKNISIIVFPNPVFDKLNIIENNNELSEIILYDIAYRKLQQQKFTNSVSLNIEQLAKGLYLYEVRSRNGLCKKGKVVKD